MTTESATARRLTAEAPTVDATIPGSRRLHKPLPMLASAMSVMLGKLATLALGFLFWVIAARLFEPAEVGLAAAVVSGMMLCTQLALLGVGSAVIHDFPDHARRPAKLLNPAITLVAVSGFVTGVGFLLVTALLSGELDAIGASPAYVGVFLAACVLGTLGILFDQSSIALRRGDQVLTRGALFGGASVLTLLILTHVGNASDSFFIFLPWLAAGLGACLLAWLQLRKSLPGYHFQPRLPRPLVRRLVGVGLPNYVLTLTERAPGLILPLVVIELLSPATNATWYVVWMMAWVIYIVPISIGLTLFAEARHHPEALRRATDQGVRAALTIGVAAAALLALLAPFALSLMGSQYADDGTTPLRILVWAVVPMVFLQAYFSSCRATGRLREAILTGAITGLVSIAAAGAAGPSYGLVGMAVAWVVCQGLAGGWALYRLSRRSRSEASAEIGDELTATPGLVIGSGRLSTALPGLLRTRHLRLGAHSEPLRLPRAATPGESPLLAGIARLRLLLVSTRAESALSAGVAAFAAVLWATSLSGVQPEHLGNFGLVSALPPAAFVALALLCASFSLAISRADVPAGLLAFHVVVLVFMLHGATSLIEQVPSFNVTWRHAGIADHILEQGSVDPSLNAYFNWPGFFALAALATEAGGLGGSVDLAGWAPVGLNLLYLPPLLVIARAVTHDRRLPWVTAWVFCLANWVHQDYFSPQGLVLLLYLGFVAIGLGWLGGEPTPKRRALICVCIVLLLAAVPSHQLTPFAMAAAATVLLMVVRKSVARRLPAIALVLAVGWLVFAAGPYLSGHLGDLTEDVGQVSSIVSANVGARIAGSEEHILVAYMRIAFTGILWLLAVGGAVRLWHAKSHGWKPLAALALAPFSLLVLQAYGGEILLRIYLFSLPFVAALIASLLLGPESRSRARSAVLIAGVSALMATGFMFTRYGTEQINLFTPGEVRLVERVQQTAPPGSVLAAPNTNLPWQSARVADLSFRPLHRELAATDRNLADAVASLLQHRDEPAGYLLITENTREYERVFGAAPWGTIDELEFAVSQSPRFQLLQASPEGNVYVLRPDGSPQ